MNKNKTIAHNLVNKKLHQSHHILQRFPIKFITQTKLSPPVLTWQVSYPMPAYIVTTPCPAYIVTTLPVRLSSHHVWTLAWLTLFS